MISIKISEQALEDLNRGFLFYEAQERGLGDYFVSCLRADIERLRIVAGVHRRVYRDYYRLLSKVFPYAVFYTKKDESVTIWAVVDMRRDPQWITDNLDG
jgi:plasmid stabilization system protein ParE